MNNTNELKESIKPISSNDLEYVANIMKMRWEYDSEWALKEAKRYSANDKNAAGFCIHDNGKTIGVGLFNLNNDSVSGEYHPWLLLLWIDPEYRGHGLGIELTRKRMDHARKHRYKEVYLDTIRAMPYHQALGWEEIGAVDFEGERDVIMRYDLSKDFPKI